MHLDDRGEGASAAAVPGVRAESEVLLSRSFRNDSTISFPAGSETVPHLSTGEAPSGRSHGEDNQFMGGNQVSFGDTVRIVTTPLTTSRGYAERVGSCWGWTTPSVSGVVDVIGGMESDSALNVHFEDDAVEDAWFAPELVEFVDHAPGTTMSFGDRKFVRGPEGEWIESKPPLD